MLITAAAGVLELTVSDAKFGRYIRLISSLCVISALISPLSSLRNISYLPEIRSNGQETYENEMWDDSTLIKNIEKNIESGIESAIGAKFGIHKISVSVDTEKNASDEVTIKKITVRFKDRGEWYRSSDVKKYVKDLMQSETEVRLNDR